MKAPVWRYGEVGVNEERLGGAEANAADLVEGEALNPLHAVERIDVDAVVDLLHHGARPARGVLDRICLPRRQRRALIHPADLRVNVLHHRRHVVRAAEHVAAANINLVFERDCHRHGRIRLRHRTVRCLNGCDLGF